MKPDGDLLLGSGAGMNSATQFAHTLPQPHFEVLNLRRRETEVSRTMIAKSSSSAKSTRDHDETRRSPRVLKLRLAKCAIQGVSDQPSLFGSNVPTLNRCCQ
jgi:hypothetical protein